ncbi:MAG: sigma-70 family RNA polymerase sigma factor, partial [Terriglobia bacterium]
MELFCYLQDARRKWWRVPAVGVKPSARPVRMQHRMGSLSGALPLPAFGRKTAIRTRVDYESTPEGALVRRAQAGDERAFQDIVERYQSKVFSIIHGIVRQRNDVEDIAQQVFAKVYFSIRNFDFRSSLITWIYKITVNECFDYLRKKKVRKLVYESDMSEDESRRVENSEPALDRGSRADSTLARRDYILKLMDKVSEEERQLLLLKEVEGYSVEELSGMLKMNENTIKVKLFRARQKLVKAAQRLDNPLRPCWAWLGR